VKTPPKILEDDYNPKMESIRPSVASLSSSLGNSPNRYSKNNPMTLSVILHSYAKNLVSTLTLSGINARKEIKKL